MRACRNQMFRSVIQKSISHVPDRRYSQGREAQAIATRQSSGQLMLLLRMFPFGYLGIDRCFGTGVWAPSEPGCISDLSTQAPEEQRGCKEGP